MSYIRDSRVINMLSTEISAITSWGDRLMGFLEDFKVFLEEYEFIYCAWITQCSYLNVRFG